jgi:hypothetical protein
VTPTTHPAVAAVGTALRVSTPLLDQDHPLTDNLSETESGY